MRRLLAIALLIPTLLLSLATSVRAHRLDEYLQATTLSLTRGTIQAELHMTPGVAVFPKIMAIMDTDRNGALSDDEQRAYANLVLQDLSLTQNGHTLPLQLVSYKFPKVAQMRDGQGDIQIVFRADVESVGGSHALVWENHHLSKISVYLANSLVPEDPHIAITGQHRDYLQTRYELGYTVTKDASVAAPPRANIWQWADTGRQFLAQGIYHIFTGPDHILFIVGLLLLGGSMGKLLKIVTAFTIAHSVTLCLATLNIFNPPARIIEPTIALSIVCVGVNSMVVQRKGRGKTEQGTERRDGREEGEEKQNGRKPESQEEEETEGTGKREQGRDRRREIKEARGAGGEVETRLLFAFLFGFIHGFGFANALHELELPRQVLVSALFSFNLGVECGQACIVLTVAPLLALLHRANLRLARRVVFAGSLSVIGMGAFWFVQRILGG